MAEIRSLRRSDLSQVMALLEARFSEWSRPRRFLERMLVDHPRAGVQPLALVACRDDGAVVGGRSQ